MAHHQCCHGSRSVAPAGGFPVAVQLASRYGDVAMLFRLGGQLERVRPWFDHTPPLAS